MSAGERPQGAFRSLRLMSDYMCVVAVWGDGACLGDLAQELGVSEDLERALLAWQEHFQQHYHHDDGWDVSENARWYCERGRRLHEWVRRELPDLEISLDLWPCAPADGATRGQGCSS